MSDSDTERDPRITKSLLGRILAVGMFVAAGTFAVMQMASSDSDVTSETGAAETEAGDTLTPTAVSNNSAGTSSSTPSSSSESSLSNSPSAPLQTASTFNPGPTPPSSPPPRNSAISPSFQPSTPPSNPATGPNSQPARFAQLPNSRLPVIGSGGGFGERPASPASEASSGSTNFKSTFSAPQSDPPKFAPPKINPTKFDPPKLDPSNASGPLASAAGTTGTAGAADTTGDATAAAQALLDQAKAATSDTANNVAANLPSQADAAKNLIDKIPALDVNRSDFPTPVDPKPLVGQTVPKSFEPPPLRQNTETSPSQPLPTMLAPVPQPAKTAFDPVPTSQSNSNSTSVPATTDNGFGGNGSFGSQSPVTAPAVRSQLQSFPEPASQASAIQAPAREPAPVQAQALPAFAAETPTRVQAQPVSAPLPTAPTSPVGRTPATLLRTANVPGDRELEGVQAPSLTIEKLSPREIQVGSPADFEIVVRNVGRVVAEDVQVHDQIPAGTEFLDADPKPASVSPDRRLQWSIGQLRAGEEQRIRFQLKPIQPGEIGSVAHVTFATQASMRTRVTKPILEIIHEAKPLVLIGDDVIIDVVVQNKGDGPAKNVLIQEDVPPQLQYQGGYRELEYEVGTLMPGQSKRVQLALKAAQVGRLKNLIFASAAGGLKAQHEIDMQVVSPKLIATASGPTRRYLQREVTHQFQVANDGTAPATNLDLITRLPAGLRFISADNRGRYDANSHAVIWKIAELPVGVAAGVELVTVPVDVGDQNLRFETSADLKQTASAEQKLQVEHLVDVFFDIDDLVDPIEIGSVTQYRITAVNQGTIAATNVQLQLEFPVGLTPTNVVGNLQNQIQGQRVQFAPISSLKPGERLELLVSAQGKSAGDHRVLLSMHADGRQTPVSKEESTRVYADQ